MSLAFHPAYPSTPYPYVSLAREVNGIGKVQAASADRPLGVGTSARVLFSAPAGSDHNASRVAFGGDGRLYLAIGDAGSPSLAQKLSSPSGKILRMTATGGVPSNNPWGTRVWPTACETRWAWRSTRSPNACGKPTTGRHATTR